MNPKDRFNNRRLIKHARERRSKMIAFGYYGGKFSHLDFILILSYSVSIWTGKMDFW